MPGRARVVRGRYGRLILERSKTLLNNVLTTTDDRELHCGRVGFSKAGKSLFSTRSFARGDAVIEYKEQVIKTQPNHEALTFWASGYISWVPVERETNSWNYLFCRITDFCAGERKKWIFSTRAKVFVLRKLQNLISKFRVIKPILHFRSDKPKNVKKLGALFGHDESRNHVGQPKNIYLIAFKMFPNL